MDFEKKSLEALVFFRFKNGDEWAFEHIFKSKYNNIIGFCEQFISNSDDAKNIAQESFVNLWLKRDEIEKSSGINSFLYTFAKSSCLNFIRHNQVVEKYTSRILNETEQRLNLEVLESINSNSLEFSELEEIIQQSIDGLPEKCRQVFVLKRFDGKMNKEIAQELNIKVKSVEANMTRALKILKEDLADYLPIVLVQLVMSYLV